MTFNTNSSVANQTTFQFKIYDEEPMICPGAPRIPFDDVNWGSPTPPPSPGSKSHHYTENATYTCVGLGIFGVSGPAHSNFNHTRTSTESSSPSGSSKSTMTSFSGKSGGAAVVVDGEMRGINGTKKKTKLAHAERNVSA